MEDLGGFFTPGMVKEKVLYFRLPAEDVAGSGPRWKTW
jgi:hypothetical protein